MWEASSVGSQFSDRLYNVDIHSCERLALEIVVQLISELETFSVSCHFNYYSEYRLARRFKLLKPA
jgi:hypothetical protein